MVDFLHDLLDIAAQRFPDKTAIVSDEGTVTYRAFADDTLRVAGWLRSRGIRRGDRVLIFLPQSIPVLAMAMGVSRVGGMFCIIHPNIKWYHLNHILQDAAPSLIVTTAPLAREHPLSAHAPLLLVDADRQEVMSTPPTAVPPQGISLDPVCLIYTSGSTGRPKAVVSAHRNVLFAAQAIQHRLQIRESDVVANFLPMSFDYGLYQAFLTFQVGATLALGTEALTGPVLIPKLLEWKVTGLPVVPSLAANLIRLAKRSAAGLPALRFLTNTGARLPRAYVEEIRALFPACQIFIMFGLTECKRVSILLPSEYDRKPDSVGRPLPDTECLIVGPDGGVLPPGSVGELVVRGPHVMPGYWRAPELTERRFRLWEPVMDRVLFTGDLCRMDAEGYLYHVGRADDIYKQNGYRVSALEVEEAACSIPGVEQAALVLPVGDRPGVLFITGEASAEAVRCGLRDRLEDYKIPPRVLQVDRMPLTTNGKVDREQLRALISDIQEAGGS